MTLVLVLLMTATLPLESAYAIPLGGSLTKLCGLLAAGCWLVTVYATRSTRQPRPAHVAALLFLLWNAASLLWTIDAGATQTRVVTYAQLFVLVLVLWDTVTTLAALTKVLAAYVLGCYLAAASLIVAYVSQGPDAAVHGRFTLGSFNPNDAGVILALALPVAAYLADTGPFTGRAKTWIRGLALTYLPVGGFAILGTGSRSAVLSGLAAFGYAGYLLSRRSPRLLLAGAAGVAAATAALLPFVPPGAMVRLLATGSEVGQGNLNDRQQVWPEALRLIQEHPGLGVGSGAFRTGAVDVNKVGHNFVLSLLAELGVVGLALFGAVLVLAFLTSRRAPAGLPALWVSISCAWVAAALLHNWEHRKITWLFLALMVASGSLRRQEHLADGEAGGLPLTAPALRVGVLRSSPDAADGGPRFDDTMAATRGRA